ncbi:hypothetical protein NW752_000190 [Fusarium irregulare]|uniref:DUF218 domain-containing protein n=1 Tax=Fusarium irregulare TaxID=2494466 RepID=A0A9W8PZQ1_9HYPO|nr:hypothetical protein NW766_001645 [Fusarium irregulare]KAJ4027940.1 hypothetical protein NW752_000190 [Fusarium irregulare]
MPSRVSKEPDSLTGSANIISKFLALEQIYSAKDLDKYLQTLQQESTHTSTDVIVLCASAILAIPEAVFNWAVQQRNYRKNTVLVLCGGIGPCTSFVYDAIRASKKYASIFEEIDGKPEGQVLRIMAERFYRLKIDETFKDDGGFDILVVDRSTNCGADALETRKVLDSHGIKSPRSITVVQDPAMSTRTMSSFEKVYDDQNAHISSWPQTGSDQTTNRVGDDNAGRLWSMDRFLDRIMGDTAHSQREVHKGTGNNFDIPNEVEDAWSTILGKDEMKASSQDL